MRCLQTRFVLLSYFCKANYSAKQIKDFHVHEEHPSNVHLTCDGTTKAFKSSCFICDFIMHEASTPTLQTYQPAVFATILTPYIFTEQVVYRHIESVNSHSPPMRA